MALDSSLKGKVTDEEWALRVELAAAYRLVARYGWDDLVYTHISARIPGTTGEFLINPYGFLFHEITASSLVKIDQNGRKLQETPFIVNEAGFNIHSAIHAVRHDAQCVLHTHTRDGIAVSAQRDGLLPLSQQAVLMMGSLAYHDYEGPVLDADERPRLLKSLGDRTHLILRNHGLLTVGQSVGEAFAEMYLLETACAIQIRAQSGGGPLIHVSAEVRERGYARAMAGRQRMGGPGQLAWPGLVRLLDKTDPSFRD